MKRPGGVTLIAVLILVMSLNGFYFAFGFFTGREGKTDPWMAMRLGDQPEPAVPVWPLTMPVLYEPLPVLGLLSLAFGTSGLAAAIGLRWVHRWAFILCLTWLAAGFAFGIGQNVYLELEWWKGATMLGCFAAFALWLATYVRQVCEDNTRPSKSPYWQRPW
jgi:hypothetical protein